MSISSTLRFLVTHPLAKRNLPAAFIRFAQWQISTRLNPRPVVWPFVGTTQFYAWKGLTGVTGNIYTGLHEFEDMAFLLHFLRADDLFADIGANVGSYTILAAGVCGSHTFTVEPLPDTFKILSDNIGLNQLSQKVVLCNIGIGAASGVLPFTRSLDTMNHVAAANDADSLIIPVQTLDEAIPRTPQLIKIDVEGFEMAVLRGADKTLSSPDLKAIIIEINRSSERYGHTPDEVHRLLKGYDFQAYAYEPFSRILTSLDSPATQNTIYLRNLEFTQKRIESAPKIKLLGQAF